MPAIHHSKCTCLLNRHLRLIVTSFELFLLTLLFVEGAENANLIVLVLIKVEAIQMAIPELQEVVIQGLLTDANVLGGLFQSYPLFGIHAPPLTYLNHNFANYALLLPAASKCLSRLSTALDECISVLSSGSRSKLQLYFVDPLGQTRDTAFSFSSSCLHQSKVEQVRYCLFGSGGTLDLSLGDLFRFLLIDIKLFHSIRFRCL